MNIWIVEDEQSLAQGLKIAFQRTGYAASALNSLAELNSMLAETRPEIVFLDIRLPDGDGLMALPHILRASPEAKVIVMTAFGDSSLIVRAIKEGAYNYLDKPFPLEAARNMAERAREAISLIRRVSRLEDDSSVDLVGSSSQMEDVRDFVNKVMHYSDINILIRGESGTGKEVVARMIHQCSAPRGQFVALNCAAIPETLLEAELFGYRKGSYTGATRDKPGLIEEADGGSLFLDEIGDMPLSLQGKLLRFLDSRTIRPLGASGEISVSLRLICATCLDLEDKIASGGFRRDLFYRISMLPLELPPLRERENDVMELLHTFIGDFSARLGRPPLSVTSEVEDVFRSYPWPGNVRELKNLVERIYILKDPGDRRIRLSDLPEEMLDALPSGRGRPEPWMKKGIREQMDAFERTIIERALSASGNNKTKAAQTLGISRYALLRRMQRHEME